MTKREEFALRILCAFISNGSKDYDVIAERAITIADDFIILLDDTELSIPVESLDVVPLPESGS